MELVPALEVSWIMRAKSWRPFIVGSGGIIVAMACSSSGDGGLNGPPTAGTGSSVAGSNAGGANGAGSANVGGSAGSITGGSSGASGMSSCVPGQTSCAGNCVALSTDVQNCGACGKACTVGQACSGGACSCQQGRTACGAACVDVQADPSNCGTCGNACAAGAVCSLGVCGASCAAGLTQCGQSCVSLSSSLEHCGACDKTCSTGQTCNMAACTCTTGTACGSQCVDVTSSSQNCGACGKACTGGKSCSAGVCACPPDTSFCEDTQQCETEADASPACRGVMDPVPVDLSCGDISVPAQRVISDFNNGAELLTYKSKSGSRGGTLWYAYGATDASTPGVGPNAFEADPNTSGPCQSGGSLKISSTGNTQWGVGFGVNFRPDTVDAKKQAFDATTESFTGVGFWMKCSTEVQFAFFKVPDYANDADVPNAVCSYDAAPYCNQYGSKNNVILKDTWTYYPLYFSEMLQDWEQKTFGNGVDVKKLIAFQVQLNTKYTRDGSTRTPNPFTCWIDDVHFLTSPAPTTPPPANVTMVNAHTIAPGGFYTEGNKIYDYQGNSRLFKGVARPSFEWDPAGFGITREDFQRIKAWGSKANVIRFSLSQGYWLSNHPKYNPLYKRYVQKAVSIALQQGLSVILDLHWVGTGNDVGQKPMADAMSVQFWQEASDLYKNDGRVLFELYNEPYGITPQVWRNGDGTYRGMQQLYDAIRAKGANNLVLVGGLDYAYDLSHLSQGGMPLTGINIAYVTHPYEFKTSPNAATAYLNVADTYPVIATEFGNANVPGHYVGPNDCGTGGYTSALANFAAKGISFTGWSWLVDDWGCGFPTLITSYAGTTTAPGAVVKSALN